MCLVAHRLLCWLTYPLYQPILDRLVSPEGDVVKLVVWMFVLLAVSLAPQYIVIATASDPTAAMNVLHTWPPCYLADFVCGCVAAACVRAHAVSGGCTCLRQRRAPRAYDAHRRTGGNAGAASELTDSQSALLAEEGVADTSGSTIRRRTFVPEGGVPSADGDEDDTPEWLQSAAVDVGVHSEHAYDKEKGAGALDSNHKAPSDSGGAPGKVARGLRARGVAADLFALALFVFVFAYSPYETEGPIARLYGMPRNYTRTTGDTSVGVGCHIWSLPVAIWLYCICATEEVRQMCCPLQPCARLIEPTPSDCRVLAWCRRCYGTRL
jgi:hypothetical protein